MVNYQMFVKSNNYPIMDTIPFHIERATNLLEGS